MQTNNSRRADCIVSGVKITVQNRSEGLAYLPGTAPRDYAELTCSLQRGLGSGVKLSFEWKVKIMLLNCSFTFTTGLLFYRRPGSRLGVVSSEQELLALLLRNSAEPEQPTTPGATNLLPRGRSLAEVSPARGEQVHRHPPAAHC